MALKKVATIWCHIAAVRTDLDAEYQAISLGSAQQVSDLTILAEGARAAFTFGATARGRIYDVSQMLSKFGLPICVLPKNTPWTSTLVAAGLCQLAFKFANMESDSSRNLKAIFVI